MAKDTHWARNQPPNTQPSPPSLYALTKGPIFNSKFPAPKIRSWPISSQSPKKFIFLFFQSPNPKILLHNKLAKSKILNRQTANPNAHSCQPRLADFRLREIHLWVRFHEILSIIDYFTEKSKKIHFVLLLHIIA